MPHEGAIPSLLGQSELAEQLSNTLFEELMMFWPDKALNL
jgi:hypothetical protein